MNLKELFEKKKVLITCHKNADIDAAASSAALAYALKSIASKLVLVFPEGLSKLSKKYYEELKIDLEYQKDIETLDTDFDYSILLDTNSMLQLSENVRNIIEKTPLIIIDHHIWKKKFPENTKLSVIKRNLLSTSAIVYNILKSNNIKIPSNILTFILAGILYDTKRLALVNPQVLRIVADIIEEGADYAKALKLMKHEMDISERIARLKASMRLKVYRVGDWLIAVTRVDAFEASVARLILEMGAHVVFVVSQPKKPNIRVIARSTPDFYFKTKISLGADIMTEIGKTIKGEGGGHDTAGGAQGTGDPEEVKILCIKTLVKKLLGREVSPNIIELK